VKVDVDAAHGGQTSVQGGAVTCIVIRTASLCCPDFIHSDALTSEHEGEGRGVERARHAMCVGSAVEC
jgi:hypothetical protein